MAGIVLASTTILPLWCFLLAALSSSSGRHASATELPYSRCYSFRNGTAYYCEAGRCCSMAHYCGDTLEYCSPGNCLFQCNPAAAAAGVEYYYNYTVAANATLHNNDGRQNNFYHGEIINKVAIVVVVNGSWDTTDCMSNIPVGGHRKDKYAWAAFGRNSSSAAPQNDNGTAASSTYCGRCMKLTNLQTGARAMVRIVQELSTEGHLEVDRETFHKLRTNNTTMLGNVDDDDHDHLLVKYDFHNC